ncbi:MAG TPA: universal stress protein [Terriglobia bacterium]|nr:universal stress protein [Terriglobia bacterium]
MQIKKVLVPVDFSPPSTLAVNHGIALARKFRAKLSLLHVVESPTALLYTFPPGAEKIEAQRKDQAEKMLPAMISPEDQDDLDALFLVKTGDVEDVIEVTAHEEQADAVVLGTHGRGLFGRLFIGSVTQALLRKLGVPVMTVCRVSRPLEFQKFLFATDFGPNSDKGFQFALDMATETGASLVVAHTLDKRPSMTYETPEVHELFDEQRTEALKQAHDKFAEFKERATQRDITIACILSEGDASETLVRIADETEADFMILGLRKIGAMARALLGSIAEPIIRAAHVPVLSVPIDTKVVAGQGTKEVQHV